MKLSLDIPIEKLVKWGLEVTKIKENSYTLLSQEKPNICVTGFDDKAVLTVSTDLIPELDFLKLLMKMSEELQGKQEGLMISNDGFKRIKEKFSKIKDFYEYNEEASAEAFKMVKQQVQRLLKAIQGGNHLLVACILETVRCYLHEPKIQDEKGKAAIITQFANLENLIKDGSVTVPSEAMGLISGFFSDPIFREKSPESKETSGNNPLIATVQSPSPAQGETKSQTDALEENKPGVSQALPQILGGETAPEGGQESSNLNQLGIPKPPGNTDPVQETANPAPGQIDGHSPNQAEVGTITNSRLQAVDINVAIDDSKQSHRSQSIYESVIKSLPNEAPKLPAELLSDFLYCHLSAKETALTPYQLREFIGSAEVLDFMKTLSIIETFAIVYEVFERLEGYGDDVFDAIKELFQANPKAWGNKSLASLMKFYACLDPKNDSAQHTLKLSPKGKNYLAWLFFGIYKDHEVDLKEEDFELLLDQSLGYETPFEAFLAVLLDHCQHKGFQRVVKRRRHETGLATFGLYDILKKVSSKPRYIGILFGQLPHFEFLTYLLKGLMTALNQGDITKEFMRDCLDCVFDIAVNKVMKAPVEVVFIILSKSRTYFEICAFMIDHLKGLLQYQSTYQETSTRIWSEMKKYFPGTNQISLPSPVKLFIQEAYLTDRARLFLDLVSGKCGWLTTENLNYMELKDRFCGLRDSLTNSVNKWVEGQTTHLVQDYLKISDKKEEILRIFEDLGYDIRAKNAQIRQRIDDSFAKYADLRKQQVSMVQVLNSLLTCKKRPFDRLEKESVKKILKELGHSNMTFGDVDNLCKLFKTFDELFKAFRAIDFEILTKLIISRLPNSQEEISFKIMQTVAGECFKILNLLIEGQGEINKPEEKKKLRELKEALDNPRLRSLLIAERVFTKEQCERLPVILASNNLLEKADQILKCRADVYELLIHFNKLNPKDKSEKFFRTLELLAKAKANQRLTLSDLEAFKGEFGQELAQMHDNLENMQNLGKLKDLITFFKDKQARHFELLILENQDGIDLDLDQQEIMGMQNIMGLFSMKAQFDGELDFIKESCEVLQSVNIVKIIEKAESLKLCSDAISKGDKDGQDIAEKIVGKATICFHYLEARNTHVVLAIPEENPEKIFKMIKENVNSHGNFESGKSIFGLQLMKETKEKVKLISAEKNTLQQECRLRIAVFQHIVEEVEGIQNSMAKIMRAGDVNDIGKFLDQLFKDHAQYEVKPPDNFKRSYTPYKKSLLILTQPPSNTMTEGPEMINQLAHFIYLNALLKEYLSKRSREIYAKVRNNHLVSLLSGRQKVFLCRVLTGDQPNSEIVGWCSSLLQFITGNFDLKFEAPQIRFKDTNQNDDILERYFRHRNLMNQEFGQLPKKLTDISARRLRFFHYETSQKYQTVYKLLLMLEKNSQKRTLSLQKMLMVSQYTSGMDIEDFLMRAFCDPHKNIYFLLDLQLLQPDALSSLMQTCKSHLENNPDPNLNCLFLFTKGSSLNAENEIKRQDSMFVAGQIPIDQQFSMKYLSKPIPLVYTSDLPGMGKSYSIQKEAAKISASLITITLAGDLTPENIEKRLEIVLPSLQALEMNPSKKICLHLKVDMMDNLIDGFEVLDHLLFKICYLKCVEFKEGYLFFHRIFGFYIEIQNTFKDDILQKVSCQKLRDPNDATKIGPLNSRFIENSMDWKLWGQESVKMVCAFYKGVKDGSIKAKSATELAYAIREHEIPSIIRELMFMNEDGSWKKEKDSSIQMIRYLIQVLAFQVSQMDQVPGLNTAFCGGNAKLERITEKSRLTTATKIVELARSLIWSVSAELREEKLHIQGMQVLDKEKALDSTSLRQYKQAIDKIPKWNITLQLNIFFNGTAMKILYKDSEVVRRNQEIIDIINFHTKRDIVDYNTLSQIKRQDALLLELIQALDLVSIFKVEEPALLQQLSEKLGSFNSKGYVLTHDNYIKILMIFQRAALAIPIVIMGATGCGKTYLINFICTFLLKDEFILFTMHSGVTEEALERQLLLRMKKLKASKTRKEESGCSLTSSTPAHCNAFSLIS
jgi:hypothetical protein